VRAVRQQADEADRAAADIQERLAATDAALAAAAAERDAKQAESTAAQVALGRVKEQHTALTARAVDLEATVRQRKVDAVNLAGAERAAAAKRLDAELTTLRATQAAADAYGDKEHREILLADLTAKRNALRADRDRLQAEGKSARAALQQVQDRAHAHDLTVRDLTNRRDSLATRLREDYGVELGQDSGEPLNPESWNLTPEQAQDEIDDLRRKIAKLGSVNLEALEELTEVEGREQALRTQHDDLVNAAKTLTEIIEKINADSRTLFTDTLATARVHFQELFRKLFGGGKADIILENEADVLESGIEVTARPPGKELRSISLLSGGEKTLTAVALLLAIFRSKPSPFCILDEVDAALDEANTVRFAGVIREFLDRSQFIVVTHKKRTMAAADVLYGVTMQESGVSKQVTVRFEDWPEEEQAAA
jgi:chromosome segregation protein